MEQQRLGALEQDVISIQPRWNAPFHSHAQDRWECFGLTMAACDSLNLSQHRLYDITFRGVEQSCQVFLDQYREIVQTAMISSNMIRIDQIFAMIMPYAMNPWYLSECDIMFSPAVHLSLSSFGLEAALQRPQSLTYQCHVHLEAWIHRIRERTWNFNKYLYLL